VALIGAVALQGTLADIITGMQSPFNISIYPGVGTADGVNGDHIMLSPAYNVTFEEVHMIVDTTVSVIKAFFDDFSGVKGS
jgi:hypothetical protein